MRWPRPCARAPRLAVSGAAPFADPFRAAWSGGGTLALRPAPRSTRAGPPHPGSAGGGVAPAGSVPPTPTRAPHLRAPGDVPRDRRPRRPPPHRPRGRRDAAVHARRDGRERQGPRPADAPRVGHADPARQHVPPRAPARPRDAPGRRRAPPVHGVGRPDPHRLRRLPGVLARRPPRRDRGRRHVPQPPHRRHAPLYARVRRRHAARHRVGRDDGARRAHAGDRRPRRGPARERPDGEVGGAGVRPPPRDGAALRARPGPLPDRPGRRLRRRPPRERRRAPRPRTPRATPSAGSPSARRRR